MKEAGGLTPKQWAFCAEYIVDLNAKQAAIRAGYSERTAESQGSRLLSNAKVRARVKLLQERHAKRAGVSAETVLEELLRLARVDISEAFNADGSMKPIREIPEDVRRAIAAVEIFEEFEGKGPERVQVGWTKKIRFWDKTRALELLGKHLKLFVERIEHDAGGSLAKLILGTQRTEAASSEGEGERADG